ncbi:GGDEF domain-containing protein [Bacillus sp. BRMEA1]|uniref:GGDEF domain-containing protein n=1 Tax=Neobacillus endophyticus TaxID=2738405 RepID=UPI0015630ECF|nr:GGDEF domain-containing protein [Neobacillus endophyticus]NRD76838.1 GGDEF domain-containing protein [Neobacillus endophyticus]
MAAYIGDIAEVAPCISQSALSKTADQIFSKDRRVQGIVMVNNEVPISLITRARFYEKMGTLYGYNLYMGRSIELIVEKEPLIVDYFQPITEVSKFAMERAEEARYDDVIVTKGNKFVGIVSIQRLLMKLVEVQVEFASLLNPLTRLPGNHSIEDQLKEVLQLEKFSVLYFDLDHFKSYNDTYGFKKGDDLLQSTAELLKRTLLPKGIFLGHIGGDDFIAILPHYDFITICHHLIKEFDQMRKGFYYDSHLSKQYVIAENRQGVKEKIALVSLSIAIVTNQNQSFDNVGELAEYAAVVKKRCKTVSGSCCFINNEST